MTNELMSMGDPHGQHFKSMGAHHPLGPHSRNGKPHRRFRRLLDPDRLEVEEDSWASPM